MDEGMLSFVLEGCLVHRSAQDQWLRASRSIPLNFDPDSDPDSDFDSDGDQLNEPAYHPHL